MRLLASGDAREVAIGKALGFFRLSCVAQDSQYDCASPPEVRRCGITTVSRRVVTSIWPSHVTPSQSIKGFTQSDHGECPLHRLTAPAPGPGAPPPPHWLNQRGHLVSWVRPRPLPLFPRQLAPPPATQQPPQPRAKSINHLVMRAVSDRPTSYPVKGAEG